MIGQCTQVCKRVTREESVRLIQELMYMVLFYIYSTLLAQLILFEQNFYFSCLLLFFEFALRAFQSPLKCVSTRLFCLFLSIYSIISYQQIFHFFLPDSMVFYFFKIRISSFQILSFLLSCCNVHEKI